MSPRAAVVVAQSCCGIWFGGLLDTAFRQYGVKLPRLAHPRFRADRLDPVGKRRNEAEIFPNVLFADPPGGDDPACRKRDGRSEDRFQHIWTASRNRAGHSGGGALGLVGGAA